MKEKSILGLAPFLIIKSQNKKNIKVSFFSNF